MEALIDWLAAEDDTPPPPSPPPPPPPHSCYSSSSLQASAFHRHGGSFCCTCFSRSASLSSLNEGVDCIKAFYILITMFFGKLGFASSLALTVLRHELCSSMDTDGRYSRSCSRSRRPSIFFRRFSFMTSFSVARAAAASVIGGYFTRVMKEGRKAGTQY